MRCIPEAFEMIETTEFAFIATQIQKKMIFFKNLIKILLFLQKN
jgi:hypothetical protein